MSTGGNPFATNNSGGGVGIQTAQPQTGPSWAYPNAPSNTYTAMPGQNAQYQTPDWLTGGLYYANQPIQNYPVTNYGRWNYNNGATNGYGMSVPSPWPSPQSLFGNAPTGPAQTAQPMGGAPNMQNQAVPPTQIPAQVIGDNFQAGAAGRFHNAGVNDQARFSFGQNPAAFASYWGGLAPAQQAAMIGSASANPYAGAAHNALLKAGVDPSSMNTLINQYYAGNAPQQMNANQAGLTGWLQQSAPGAGTAGGYQRPQMRRGLLR